MLRNIYLVFLYNFFWALLVLMPVIVPFFESRGLSMQNIFELQAVFAITMLILEIPSGYLSDLMGRKKVLIFAAVSHGVGFSIFYFTSSFNHLVIAEIFLALAVSLFSGSDVSLIYDSLEASGKTKAPIKLMGRKLFFSQIGETLGGLIGGWLLLWSMDAPVIVQAFVAWLPIIPALFIEEPPRKLMSKVRHRENINYIYKSLFKHSRLLTLILLCGMFYSVATLVAVWAYQRYWQELDIPLIYFGYLWAATNLTVAIFGRYAHKIEKKLGSFKVILIIGILPVVGFLGMGNTPFVWGVLFCLCFQVTRALSSVVITDAINKRVSADMRATANSVKSLGVRGLFIILGPAMGYLIDKQGVFKSFNVIGGIYVFLFFLIIVPLLRQRKSYAPID